MSFESLNKAELKAVAEFFVVDVEAADKDKGPSKKELVAALAAGDEPVTWKQYNELYLPQAEEFKEATTEKPAEPVAPVEEEEVDKSNWVFVKFEGKNPTLQVVGLTFTPKHPYAQVDPDTAAYLVRNVDKFSLALPDEVADYYN